MHGAKKVNEYEVSSSHQQLQNFPLFVFTKRIWIQLTYILYTHV